MLETLSRLSSPTVLIGKAGSMTTTLEPDECSERLRRAMRSFMWGSRSDSAGFRLASAGRTAARIRGTFAGRPEGGTVVAYRVELLPVTIVSLAIATPLGLVVISVILWLAHQSLYGLLWFVPIAVVVIAANLWISDIQAGRLIRFVSQRLEAT